MESIRPLLLVFSTLVLCVLVSSVSGASEEKLSPARPESAKKTSEDPAKTDEAQAKTGQDKKTAGSDAGKFNTIEEIVAGRPDMLRAALASLEQPTLGQGKPKASAAQAAESKTPKQ